jgi:hypothetical protein
VSRLVGSEMCIRDSPSAMVRVCEEYGIPQGVATEGEDGWTINDYSSKTWYNVKIKINSINKSQNIPSVSYKDKKGLLRYTNEIPEEGIVTYVDRITLEDYITYHDIQYDIIEGIYWDGSVNRNLKDVILELFNERLKVKDTNEPLGNMIKLIMNSIYGKTCQRRCNERVVYKDHQQAESYYFQNFGIIKEYAPNRYNTRIVEKEFDDEFSMNFIGSAILSMSKRIMNEVFDIMNDNNMPVYYTDTDSIHMREADQENLSRLYMEKYGKVLIGKKLGQFSSDFKMEENPKDYTNVESILFVALAPKVYMDVLKGVHKVTGEVKYDTHVRIKGINKTAINYEILKRKKEKKKTNEKCCNETIMIDIFRDLVDGKEIEFILNPTKFDPSFEYKNGYVRSRGIKEFKRLLKFPLSQEELHKKVVDEINDINKL